MSGRVVLVLDNDIKFIELLRRALEVYGYDVQASKSSEDGIHKVKTIKPNAVFVGVEIEDTHGFSLCTKAKKAAGKKVPVILTTSTLDEDDCKLHEKQRFSADHHIIKNKLNTETLIKEIEKKIDLSPEPETRGKKMEAMTKNSGILDSDDEPIELEDEIVTQSDGEDVAEIDDDEGSGWLERFMEKAAKKKAVNKDAGQSDIVDEAIADILEDESDDVNDLDERLAEQDREILNLRRKLAEARREARSSPFSSDYLNLQEEVSQKDSELIHLSKKQFENNKKREKAESRLKDVATRLVDMKNELDESLERQEQLTKELDGQKEEFDKLQKEIEEKTEKEVRKRLESDYDELRIEHKLELKKIEESHLSELVALKKKYKEAEDRETKYIEDKARQKSDEIIEEHEAAIAKLKKKHEAELSEFEIDIKKQYEAEIKELKASIDNLKGDKWDQVEKDHENSIDELRAQHEEEIAEFNSVIEELKLAGNEERNEAIADMVKEKDDVLEKIKAEYEAEITELKSTLEKFESDTDNQSESIEKIKEQHDKELNKLLLEIEDIRQSSKKEIKQSLSVAEGNYLSQLNDLEARHKSEMVKLKVNKQNNSETEQKLSKEIETLDKNYKNNLHELDMKYTAEIKQFNDQKKKLAAKIKKELGGDLKKAIAALNKEKAALNNEKKAHTKLRASFEALNLKYAEAVEQGSSKEDPELEKVKEDLELKLKQANDALEREKKAHEDTRISLESKLVSKMIAQSKQ